MMVDAYRGMSKGFNPTKVLSMVFHFSLMLTHTQEFLIKMEMGK